MAKTTSIFTLDNKLLLKVRGGTLRGANLRGANLRGAALSEADLSEAALRGANLSEAALRGANLSGANLSWAALRGANLRGANLIGADLRGAALRGAYLSGPHIIDAGQDSRGYRFVAVPHANGLRIAAGCRWFTAEEALIHWARNYEAMGKVRMILAEARRREWVIQPAETLGSRDPSTVEQEG